MVLYLATSSGMVFAERDEDWRVTSKTLEGHNVTSVTAQDGLVLAGTVDGILRSNDRGSTWRAAVSGPELKHIRWLEQHEDQPGVMLAGTEPAGIFYSTDGGQNWQVCPEVAELRDRFHWSLPYSPEAGCVRGFALHGERVYAAVEVGGVLVSTDGGQSWQLVAGSDGNPGFRRPPDPRIHPDVHSILVHSSSPEQVYAPTGGGFYRSEDGGATWRLLYDCYCRAAWVDPANPDHIIFGPASGVDHGGRIEATNDGGMSWDPASTGLTVPWPENMVERFLQVGDELLAILSDGSLLSTPLAALSWRSILPEVTKINAAAVG